MSNFKEGKMSEQRIIFIVEASFGSWDDAYTRVLKAFFTKEDAEQYKAKAERVIRAMSKHVTEAFTKTKTKFKRLDYDSSDEYWAAVDKYEQTPEYQIALSTWSAHADFQGFNKCSIEEIEIR
jgi:hypothetical protein